VEAAISLQLLAFTEWPEGSEDGKIMVGVVGGEGIVAVFEELLSDSRYAAGFEVRELDDASDLAEIVELDALFFADNDPQQNPRIIRKLEGRPVVLIGVYEGFLEQGGMILLSERQKRIGFEIHLGNARESRIEFRAKLLRLAQEVYR